MEPPQPVNLPIGRVATPLATEGLCVDFSLVYSTYSWTFQSGVTYLLEGNLTISDSTVFQTNSILKYRRNAYLTLSGTITTPSTGPPAILTSVDDYTAGELLPGGNPVGYCGADTALHLYNISGVYGADAIVQNLEIRHARTAIADYSPDRSHIIRNCRFHVCQTGLNAYYTTVTVSNLVACAVPTLTTNSGYATISTSAITTDCQRTVDTGGNNDYGQRNVPIDLTNVVAVAGGDRHSLALIANGTVVGWGANNFGQLNVPSALSNVIGIAAGAFHSLALKADGTVLGWGHNGYGQINVPLSATNVIDIKAGNFHSLALKSDGTVQTWGYGGFGLSPVPSDLTNIVAISAIDSSSMALRSNGTIRVWGGAMTNHHTVPLTNAVAISVGNCHALALKANGALVAWGCNPFGQTTVPPDATDIITMASALNTIAAVKRNGSVRTWGFSQNGNTSLPTGLTNVVAAASGNNHFVFVRAGVPAPTISTQPRTQSRFVGSTVTFTVTAYSPTTVTYQWRFNGTNITGATNASLTLTNLQVADAGSYTVVISNGGGDITSSVALLTVIAEPIILSQPSDLRVLAGGNLPFSITLSNAAGATNYWQLNGTTVFASSSATYTIIPSAATHGVWTVISSNQVGATLSDPWTLQVILRGQAVGWGDTSFGQTNAPYPVTNLIAVAAGYHHSLGLKDDGTIVGWGTDMAGEATAPSGLTDVVAISAGWCHSLALKGNGTVMAWGDSTFGQTNLPSGLSTLKAIAAGYWHNLALRTNGTVVGWGNNDSGQTTVPANLTNAIAVAAGWQHSLALRDDGTVCSWGLNNSGQCNVPAGLTNVVAIAAGTSHSLALKIDGTVVGWGESVYGETNPPAALSNVLAIAAGQNYSLALKNDGTVVAWGTSDFGVTNVPSPLGDVYAIAAGGPYALALTYSPVVNYVINPSQDLLLICNTNCADSVAVMNYYRTNRPMVANANVLGIGGVTNAIERYADLFETTNTLITPVLNWLTNNPTKRRGYMILFYGVPASTIPFGGLTEFGGVPSSSYLLWSVHSNRKPSITHINMRTPQDCFAYVDKLANFGTNYSPGRIYISAHAGGYANTNYFFDDVSVTGNAKGACASNGVVSFGASTSQISYVHCASDLSTNCYGLNLFHCTNVVGYLSWGYHGGLETGFPTNGNVRFYDSSSWYIIETMESFNGQWVPFHSQTSFHDYFASTAFWGTNYSRTPVGTVSHTFEPGITGDCGTDINAQGGGVASPFKFFGLWQAKRHFGACAWVARGTDRFQAVGDPFVMK